MPKSIACCQGTPISAGTPGNKRNLGEAVFPIFMRFKDSTGAINGIPKGTVIDQTFILGKLNNPDETLRWTMFPKMSTHVANPSVPETEDIDAVTRMTGFNTKQPLTWDHAAGASFPFLIRAYEDQACEEVGVLFVTRGFHITGVGDGDGNLLAEKIEDSTISAVLQREQNQLSSKIQVSITPDSLEDESCQDWISSCDVEFSAKNWFALSPIEVQPVLVSETGALTIVLDLGSLASGFAAKFPTEGLLSADFSFDDGVTPATVFNKTTSLSLVVVSTPDAVIKGRYSLALPIAQTVNDIIKIDIFKSGLRMESFEVKLS